MDRSLKGTQSCNDRLYRQQQYELEKEIATLEKQIETEGIVFDTVKTHLTSKREQLLEMSGARDKLREKEIEKLDMKLKEIDEEST